MPAATEKQQRIADSLTANGYAEWPLRPDVRFVKTVALNAVPDAWGHLFVMADGEIRVGFTLSESTPVDPLTRRMMLGEDAAAEAGEIGLLALSCTGRKL